MARDILEAIREDVGIFEQVQQRFSDLHGSSDLGVQRLQKKTGTTVCRVAHHAIVVQLT